ncbi:MAG: hypothetical protein ACOH2E_03420 [Candidatus Paracaedibacter sp.]
MKIFKVLSIGLIAFLGILEGKAAENRRDSEPVVAKELLSFIETTRTYLKDIQNCENTRQQQSGIVVNHLSIYPEIEQNERGFNSSFDASKAHDTVLEMQKNGPKIQELINTIRKLHESLEEMCNAHLLSTTPTLQGQQAAHEIAPYIQYGIPTPCIPLEEGTKNSMRVLTSADLSTFKNECERFRIDSLDFAQDENFDCLTGGLKSSFDFYDINQYVQKLIGILESVKQSNSPAGNAVAKIFYEKDKTKNRSKNYKENLLSLIKVIDENQKTAFLEFFTLTQSQEFSGICETIKDYFEANKAKD